MAESFRALLSMPSEDRFDPVFLRDEPVDAMKRVVEEARAIHQLM